MNANDKNLAALTEDEKYLMDHISMWGSAGYPVQKIGRGWHWTSFRSVGGSPIVYKTKRAAVAAFESFMDMLRERNGEEAKSRALAALAE